MARTREIINIGFGFTPDKRFPELEPAELVRQFFRGQEARKKGVGYGVTAITTDSRGNDWYLGHRESVTIVGEEVLGARLLECAMVKLDERRHETSVSKTLRIHYRDIRAHFENGFVPTERFED